jgi:hypothetical protein
LAVCRTGTSVIASGGGVRTSIARRPEAGKTLSLSSASGTVFAGSTSATTRSPGSTSEPSTRVFQVLVISPSSRPVGTVSAGDSMTTLRTSVFPRYRRTRTWGRTRFEPLASAVTRSSASRPETSGTVLSNVWTLWVR